MEESRYFSLFTNRSKVKKFRAGKARVDITDAAISIGISVPNLIYWIELKNCEVLNHKGDGKEENTQSISEGDFLRIKEAVGKAALPADEAIEEELGWKKIFTASEAARKIGLYPQLFLKIARRHKMPMRRDENKVRIFLKEDIDFIIEKMRSEGIELGNYLRKVKRCPAPLWARPDAPLCNKEFVFKEDWNGDFILKGPEAIYCSNRCHNRQARLLYFLKHGKDHRGRGALERAHTIWFGERAMRNRAKRKSF